MTTSTVIPRVDIYSRITNNIVELLERGIRPWHKPWSVENGAQRITRPLRANGKPYSGVNILTLWGASEVQGFSSPFWLTFKQAAALGGHVKKGERGSTVVYAGTFTKSEVTEVGEETDRKIPFLRQYSVFNAEQCQGLPGYFYEIAEAVKVVPAARIEQAERFFANTGADVRTGGNQAYYSIDDDYIRMPPFEAFRDPEAHAATLAHELIHWTSHSSRLRREFGCRRFGGEGYAVEELVAELGAAFLCADLCITPDVRQDHADYIGSWLTVLKNDKRAVFSAASHASKAVEFLHGLQT